MIKEEDYLKSKQIVQEYENKLNIGAVICSACGGYGYTIEIEAECLTMFKCK